MGITSHQKPSCANGSLTLLHNTWLGMADSYFNLLVHGATYNIVEKLKDKDELTPNENECRIGDRKVKQKNKSEISISLCCL